MVKETKYAVFTYEENDAKLIEEIAEYLESQAEEIYKFFGLKFDGARTNYKVIPTKSEYDREYRKIYKLDHSVALPDWFVGTCKENKITMISFNDYKNIESHKDDTLDHYKKTIVHEFVHFVNELFQKINNCSYTEKYLSEGIACYLSHQYDDKDVLLNCTIEDVIDRNKNVNYRNYYLLTKYLVENYDKAFVLELFKSNRQAREFLKSELYEKTQQFELNK